MTTAEKIAALEAAREKLDDMIITTARLYATFDSAEAAPIGHISALYQDRGAIDDLLYELRGGTITYTIRDGQPVAEVVQ